MRHLNTPAELVTNYNHNMLLFILFPKFALQPIAQRMCFNSMSEPEKATLKVCSYEIFKENNRLQRHTFFAQPFIQFLWSIYINERPQSMIEILRCVRSAPTDGQY